MGPLTVRGPLVFELTLPNERYATERGLSVLCKGVDPSQKVRGTDSKLGRSGGMLPEIFLNFGTLKRHFQRFEGTYKVIVQCA